MNKISELGKQGTVLPRWMGPTEGSKMKWGPFRFLFHVRFSLFCYLVPSPNWLLSVYGPPTYSTKDFKRKKSPALMVHHSLPVPFFFLKKNCTGSNRKRIEGVLGRFNFVLVLISFDFNSIFITVNNS